MYTATSRGIRDHDGFGMVMRHPAVEVAQTDKPMAILDRTEEEIDYDEDDVEDDEPRKRRKKRNKRPSRSIRLRLRTSSWKCSSRVATPSLQPLRRLEAMERQSRKRKRP